MKYRNRTDIAAQILQVASKSRIAKTKIMYGAYLSHAQLTEYLDVLTKNGLLEFHQGEETYRTTEKGNRFLDIYNKMDAFVTASPSVETMTS